VVAAHPQSLANSAGTLASDIVSTSSHERVLMETYEKFCTDFRALSYEYPMTPSTSAHAQFLAVKHGFHSFQLLNTPLSVSETEWQES